MPSSQWDEALATKYRSLQYHFPDQPLEERVLLLAGRTGGLGAATTVLLAREGAKLVVSYRSNLERAEALRAAVAKQTGETITLAEEDVAAGEVATVHCPRFQEFIGISGMTHVRTSPDYPQPNGKLERRHKSLKSERIRPGTPLSLEDAKRLNQQYVNRYNTVQLHSAIGYVTPQSMLDGRQQEILAERDRKLEAAREQRRTRRQQLEPTSILWK